MMKMCSGNQEKQTLSNIHMSQVLWSAIVTGVNVSCESFKIILSPIPSRFEFVLVASPDVV